VPQGTANFGIGTLAASDSGIPILEADLDRGFERDISWRSKAQAIDGNSLKLSLGFATCGKFSP
jgi:hypothetical protein